MESLLAGKSIDVATTKKNCFHLILDENQQVVSQKYFWNIAFQGGFVTSLLACLHLCKHDHHPHVKWDFVVILIYFDSRE